MYEANDTCVDLSDTARGRATGEGFACGGCVGFWHCALASPAMAAGWTRREFSNSDPDDARAAPVGPWPSGSGRASGRYFFFPMLVMELGQEQITHAAQY